MQLKLVCKVLSLLQVSYFFREEKLDLKVAYVVSDCLQSFAFSLKNKFRKKVCQLQQRL